MWNRKIFIDGKCGTVEGSGATSSNKLLECFLQSRWLIYGPVDTKNTKYFKKVRKKTRPKCIAIYANGHGDPWDKWVKKSIFCFHRPPGALFEGFRTPWCPTIFFFWKKSPSLNMMTLDHISVDEDELRRCRVTSQDRIQGSAVIREINWQMRNRKDKR